MPLTDDLARLLSQERRLLELLLFKLVEGRHLLAAGEAGFLPLRRRRGRAAPPPA
ncbi:MAG: hypothetical protein ACRDYF_05500 [Acidimicrobiia bacterium]